MEVVVAMNNVVAGFVLFVLGALVIGLALRMFETMSRSRRTLIECLLCSALAFAAITVYFVPTFWHDVARQVFWRRCLSIGFVALVSLGVGVAAWRILEGMARAYRGVREEYARKTR